MKTTSGRPRAGSRLKAGTVARGLAVLSAALIIAACSSSSSSSGGGATGGASTGTATGSAIKIGVICTCSGPLASEGTGAPKVYQAWADTVNAAGGINGHPVQIILKDDAGNPATSLTDVKGLVQSSGVVALVDMTNLDETWASFVKSANVPVVGINTSETPMYSNSEFYPQAQTEDALFPSIIDAAKTGGAKNLGLLYCAEAVQCQEGIAPLKQTGQALGLPVTYTGEISATAPNYTAQCVAAQQAHIQALFLADITAVDAKVAQDCSRQGYHPIYVVDGQVISPIFATTAGLKDNLIGPSPNVPFYATSPAITAMNAAIDKYFPGLRQDGANYNEYSMGAWPSGLLFQAAAKAGGLGANGSTPTSAQLVTGLNAVKGETLGGLAPSLTFTAGQPHPIHCWFTFALKNGTFSLPNGTTATCEKS
jgi:branched-chain amino acid transport system substrate-binding protein